MSAPDPLAAFAANVLDAAKALASGDLQPAAPRDAATVVLARDGADGLEIYLLRRTASMAFAAGAFVFPGGSVDVRDQDIADEAWVGPPPSEWAKALSADDHIARALVCAAVRETFEESGVLLAGPDADSVVADTSGDDWEADRLALLDRSLSMSELLRRRGLVLRADLLRVWTHWLTPEVEPRRFDTRFFVAALPAGQRTRDVGGEADTVVWMKPADALSGSQRGEMMLMPPTVATITDVSACATVAEILDAADRRDVVRIMPKIVVDDNDSIRFLLPHDPDYPADPS
jgi:8-oxo-dGTP pyrophosphatase MutT (NUDIX family)